MIEQKSIDKSLTAPIKQSDGSLLTPFQQACGFRGKLNSESECVVDLMKMCQELVEK